MQNLSPVVPVQSHGRRNVATVVATVLAFLVIPGTAHASLLGGAETSFFDSIQTFLTTDLLPKVFVLAAIVIGVGMLIRYGRKAVSS